MSNTNADFKISGFYKLNDMTSLAISSPSFFTDMLGVSAVGLSLFEIEFRRSIKDVKQSHVLGMSSFKGQMPDFLAAHNIQWIQN